MPLQISKYDYMYVDFYVLCGLCYIYIYIYIYIVLQTVCMTIGMYNVLYCAYYVCAWM